MAEGYEHRIVNQVNGQVIKASASFAAFNADLAGSNLYVVSLNDTGRRSNSDPLLHAHSDLVTDLDFSPFDDGLLTTEYWPKDLKTRLSNCRAFQTMNWCLLPRLNAFEFANSRHPCGSRTLFSIRWPISCCRQHPPTHWLSGTSTNNRNERVKTNQLQILVFFSI